MDISYRMESDLDWNNAERIDINPKGWKPVVISFIDSYPTVFWRMNQIDRTFYSDSGQVSNKGVHSFFTETLETLKIMVVEMLDRMPEERKRFYEENILELFDE